MSLKEIIQNINISKWYRFNEILFVVLALVILVILLVKYNDFNSTYKIVVPMAGLLFVIASEVYGLKRKLNEMTKE